MRKVIINFELPTGHFVVASKTTKNGCVLYYVHDTLRDCGYISEDYDEVWGDFMTLIDSLNYMK